jgi:hypothetical protein
MTDWEKMEKLADLGDEEAASLLSERNRRHSRVSWFQVELHLSISLHEYLGQAVNLEGWKVDVDVDSEESWGEVVDVQPQPEGHATKEGVVILKLYTTREGPVTFVGRTLISRSGYVYSIPFKTKALHPEPGVALRP